MIIFARVAALSFVVPFPTCLCNCDVVCHSVHLIDLKCGRMARVSWDRSQRRANKSSNLEANRMRFCRPFCQLALETNWDVNQKTFLIDV